MPKIRNGSKHYIWWPRFRKESKAYGKWTSIRLTGNWTEKWIVCLKGCLSFPNYITRFIKRHYSSLQHLFNLQLREVSNSVGVSKEIYIFTFQMHLAASLNSHLYYSSLKVNSSPVMWTSPHFSDSYLKMYLFKICIPWHNFHAVVIAEAGL